MISFLLYLIGVLINLRWLFGESFDILGIPAYVYGLGLMGLAIMWWALRGENF